MNPEANNGEDHDPEENAPAPAPAPDSWSWLKPRVWISRLTRRSAPELAATSIKQLRLQVFSLRRAVNEMQRNTHVRPATKLRRELGTLTRDLDQLRAGLPRVTLPRVPREKAG